MMAKKDFLYLDYNATAPVRPEVISLMAEVLAETGNASSVHSFGRAARARVEKAREQVAALAGVHPNQVIFTSGATEANNAVMAAFKDSRILAGATEHPSVLEAAPDAERIPVTPDGLIDEQAFEKILKSNPPPALISIMLVNNETGVIHPVADLARRARAVNRDVFIHTDAVQGAGRISLDMPGLYADYMSLSAHKFGGPQGVGALVTAPGAKPAKLLFGGGQEKRQRAGTENVAAIAGFGLAAEIALNEMAAYQKLSALRDKLESTLKERVPELRVFGANAPRVANTSCLSLSGVPSYTQLMNMDLAGIALSNGSACASGKVEASHVLRAMGASEDETASSLRISMGWGTKTGDIDRFIAEWLKLYERIKDKVKATSHG